MNLRTDPDRVIRALVEVEGERWLERQKAGQFKGFSVFEAIEKLKAAGPAAPVVSDWSVYVIYGRDGWNRYRVQVDGEVCFIKLMAGQRKDIGKARKAGFRIW